MWGPITGKRARTGPLQLPTICIEFVMTSSRSLAPLDHAAVVRVLADLPVGRAD